MYLDMEGFHAIACFGLDQAIGYSHLNTVGNVSLVRSCETTGALLALELTGQDTIVLSLVFWQARKMFGIPFDQTVFFKPPPSVAMDGLGTLEGRLRTALVVTEKQYAAAS